MAEEQFSFGSFRCDPVNACVWSGEQAVGLPPKAFEVLLYLLRHPGQLVSKEDLLNTIWAETYVGEAVLKVAIAEIRKVLADNPKQPQFIETVHRRGYRFVAAVTTAPVSSSSFTVSRALPPTENNHETGPASFQLETWNLKPETLMVGREGELARLHALFEKSLAGERQIVFVTGEPGIGKTTLIEAFLGGLGNWNLGTNPPSFHHLNPNSHFLNPRIFVARGQCVEHYGVEEAYLPILEAIGELGRGSRKEQVVKWLIQYAPTWLAQMPALTSLADRQHLRQEVVGATSERMLREGAEALEALTREAPLILVLEDLHWSDYATLDLVAALARRQEAARLFVLGTYRPVDVIVSDHPLKRLKLELQGRGQCKELALALLASGEVEAYLTRRFPESTLPERVADIIHQRTDGNPLFLTTVVEDLIAQGVFYERDGRWELHGGTEQIAAGLPESTRQMIERQMERLTPEEQRTLEAASAIGMEFSAATVDAALEELTGTSEERCERLVRQQHFLHAREPKTWPDGTVTGSYAFTHALYQQVLSQRLLPARRLRVHQRIGEQLEAVYQAQTDTIAAELAMHFEEGRDYQRAVRYLRSEASKDFQRYANREAIRSLSHALGLVERLLENEQRVSIHLEVLHQLGLAYRMAGDLPAASERFAALRTFAHRNNRPEWEVTALLHAATALSWLDHPRCLAAAEEAVALSQQFDHGELHLHARAYYSYWHSLAHGWRAEDAQVCAQALEVGRQAKNRDLIALHIGRVLYFHCVQAQYQQACRIAEEEMQAAWQANDALSYITCQFFRSWALLYAGRWGEMRAALTDGEQMANRNQTPVWQTSFRLEKAWLCMQCGDWSQARELSAVGLRQAQEIGHKYSELLGETLLGHAYLGMGDAKHAIRHFRAVNGRSPGVLIDWITRMPLLLGLSAYWLTQNDYERARAEAEQLCALAGQSGEHTYLALGHRMLSVTASVQHQWEDAEQAVTTALSVLEGKEAPLAAWRVWATAARIAERRRRKAQARTHWQQSKAVVMRLADSLRHEEPLRQTFLAQPEVREVLKYG